MRTIYLVTAIWCGGCKVVKPILGKLKQEGFNIVEVDAESVDRDPLTPDVPSGWELRKTYSFKNLPTVIVTEDGKELGKIEGRANEEQYRELFNK